MRIFYASENTPNAAFHSNLWRSNLYLSLVDLGHQVIEFDYDLRKTFQNLDPSDRAQHAFIAKNRPRISKAVFDQLTAAHSVHPIDLFFSYFYEACILPETLEAIHDLGITTVNWYCNGSYQFHLVRAIAPYYDWSLVPEKFRLDDYRAIGARPIYCQEAANPSIYKPYDLPCEFDVTFVGQAYGDRPAYIRQLLDQGIDVHVWGTSWERYAIGGELLKQAFRAVSKFVTPEGWRSAYCRFECLMHGQQRVTSYKERAVVTLPRTIMGGPLSDEELIRMYSRSKINLGFSTCGNTHETEERIVQIRLRDFEVPMSGGFYMVEYMEELEEFYDIGKEIVCYNGPEDLAEKIKYYLAHDSEREAIRVAGYERCRRDHTWQRRFEAAFREMGLA